MYSSFHDLWSAWLSGQPIAHERLFGVPIYWLSRVGISLQFMSAWVLLIELVGVNRMRSFGASLHTGMGPAGARRRRMNNLRWLGSMRVFWRTEDDARESRALERSERFGIDNVHLVMSLVLLTTSVVLVWGTWWAVLAFVAAFPVVYCWGLPLITFWLSRIGDGLGLLIDYATVRPVTWLLTRDGFEQHAKLGSLVVLAIGTFLSALST